ncbi:hypothetical protein D3C83_38010 [compost metagenome]
MGTRPPVVGLVDRQQHRLVRRVQHARDVEIARHHAFAAICHEHKQIRVRDGAPPAFEHEFVQRIGTGAEHPPGVDEREVRALPFDGLRHDVAGRAGNGRDDRAPGTGEAIEQRGLADVRPSDESYRCEGSRS